MLTCFVYGQGRCSPGDPYYYHYEKRLIITEFLRSLGVDTWMPEDLDIEPERGEGWLDAQLRISRTRDLIVALQPPDSGDGPPTLREEVAMAAADAEAASLLYLFAPVDSDDDWIDDVAMSLTDDRIFFYAAGLYAECEEIRDLLRRVVDRLRERDA